MGHLPWRCRATYPVGGAGDGDRSSAPTVAMALPPSDIRRCTPPIHPRHRREPQVLIAATRIRRATGASVVPFPCTQPADPYRPSTSLQTFVRARDQYCVWPGCTRPASKADLDHSTEYDHDNPADGGQTRPECLVSERPNHRRQRVDSPRRARSGSPRTRRVRRCACAGSWRTPRPRSRHRDSGCPTPIGEFRLC